MEAEHGDVAVAAIADRFAQIAPTDGMRGILDNFKAKPLAQGMDSLHVARLPTQMHWHHHFRQLPCPLGFKQFGFQRLRAEVVSVGVDVNEIDLCAAIAPAIGGGDKGDGSRPQPIARAELQRETSQMQRRGRTVDCHRMLSAAVVGNGCFKTRYYWTLREKVRLQHFNYGRDIGVRDLLTSVGNHATPASWLNSMISSIVRNCGFVPELYSKPCSTGRPFSPSSFTVKSLLRLKNWMVGRST